MLILRSCQCQWWCCDSDSDQHTCGCTLYIQLFLLVKALLSSEGLRPDKHWAFLANPVAFDPRNDPRTPEKLQILENRSSPPSQNNSGIIVTLMISFSHLYCDHPVRLTEQIPRGATCRCPEFAILHFSFKGDRTIDKRSDPLRQRTLWTKGGNYQTRTFKGITYSEILGAGWDGEDSGCYWEKEGVRRWPILRKQFSSAFCFAGTTGLNRPQQQEDKSGKLQCWIHLKSTNETRRWWGLESFGIKKME